MNKDEYFTKHKNSISLSKGEFNTEFDKVVKELKERGLSDKEVEENALKVMHAKLRKQLLSAAKKFKGYIIGINPNAGLNNIVKKVWDDSMLLWRTDESKAVDNKITDASGNPLWHIVENVNVADWKLGHPITDDDYQESVVLLSKQEDDEEYKLSFLTLRGANRKLVKPMFKLVEFMANIKSDEGKYQLNESKDVTAFKIIEDKEIDFPTIAKKLLAKHCVSIEKLEAWHSKNALDYDRIAITKGMVINIVPSLDGGRSHLVNLDSEKMNYDVNPVLCWIDGDKNLNFNDLTPEIYIIGATSVKEDDDGGKTVSMNAYGFFTPEKWRVGNPEEITEDKTTEKTESVSSEEVDDKEILESF